MIAYDGATARDGRLYWEGSIVFRYDKPTGEVHALRVDGIAADGNSDLFDSVDVFLRRIRAKGTDDNAEVVAGEMITKLPQYISHRFPLGYVALEDDTLVRVSAEARRSATTKGIVPANLRYHPLVYMTQIPPLISSGLRHKIDALQGAGVERLHSHQGNRVLLGIAAVLSLGGSPAMRLNLTEGASVTLAHEAVRKFFGDKERVTCVTGFPVALVKCRNDRQKALLLMAGAVIGVVCSTAGDTRATVWVTGNTRAQKRAMATGLTAVVRRYICNQVEVSHGQ